MAITTATFEFISHLSLNVKGEMVEIKNSGQIFDHLVHVRWLSGPKEGEEGLLLCSHCCNWPNELIDAADFIEGCFTPTSFKDDSRLALGYHPGSVTTWNESNLVISTNDVGETDFSLTFQREWALGLDLIEEVQIPKIRRLQGLFRLFAKTARTDMTAREIFSAMEQRFLEGAIPISYQLWSYMLAALAEEDIHLCKNGDSRELPEYGEFCEVSGNLVRVILESESKGFLKPEEFPFEEQFKIEGEEGEGEMFFVTEVTKNYPEWGWHVAIDI